jgi:hypothetical protein
MRQYLVATIFCIVLLSSMQRLYGLFGFQLFEAPLPERYLDDEIIKTFIAPNRWMYRVYWIDPASSKGLQRSFKTIYEFTDRKLTDPEKAIRLFIDIYKEHFKRLSSIRILRPFLYEFPITPATCPLSINFYDSNRNFCKPPAISNVYADTKSLLCSQYDEKGRNGIWHVDIYKKPLIEIEDFRVLYEQGVKRGKPEQLPKIPILKSLQWQDKIPSMYRLFDWINTFCKKCCLIPLATGSVGDRYNDDRPFDFLLMGYQQLTLNEAKQIGSRCCKECLHFISSDKDCCTFLREQSTKKYAIHPSPTAIPEHIAFRISFWDENIDRPIQPYIAEIRCFDGVFKYYTADEVQKLVLVHEETFDKVMQVVDQSEGAR